MMWPIVRPFGSSSDPRILNGVDSCAAGVATIDLPLLITVGGQQ